MMKSSEGRNSLAVVMYAELALENRKMSWRQTVIKVVADVLFFECIA